MKRTSRGRFATALDDAEVGQAAALRSAGWTQRELAATFWCGLGTVSRALARWREKEAAAMPADTRQIEPAAELPREEQRLALISATKSAAYRATLRLGRADSDAELLRQIRDEATAIELRLRGGGPTTLGLHADAARLKVLSLSVA